MLKVELLHKISNDLGKKLDLVTTLDSLENTRIEFLGRKNGTITNLFAEIPKLSNEEKRKIVPLLNKLKKETEEKFEKISKRLSKITPKKIDEKGATDIYLLDPTIPTDRVEIGHKHPTLLVIDEIKEIFHYLGFGWMDGPEIEFDLYNFQKLRLHKDHPARDTQQTYYINQEVLLRTQTSTMQIRYMEQHKPPIRMLFPGRVYRRENLDATHLPAFYQLEGLLVDKKTTMTELIGVLDLFAKKMFGEKTKIRIYGHHFPYTEPSIEVEVLNKSGRWIEILGAGMVHPEVLTNCNIDPKVYRGFAFGMGPERIAMLKYGISDIRSFYSNEVEFLEQF